MTSLISNFYFKLFKRKKCFVLIVGNECSGKSSILYRLITGDFVDSFGTTSFNHEIYNYKNIEFSFLDSGGRYNLPTLWPHYASITDSIIFVFDISERNPEEILKAKMSLHKTISGELKRQNLPLLIFASKKDKEIISVEEIPDLLDLNSLKGIKWNCISCSAKNGEGIFEGIEWLYQHVI